MRKGIQGVWDFERRIRILGGKLCIPIAWILSCDVLCCYEYLLGTILSEKKGDWDNEIILSIVRFYLLTLVCFHVSH